MTYARNTDVSTDKSKAEIERLLSRYGADQFMSGWDRTKAYLAFRMSGKQIKIVVPMPSRDDESFTLTESRKWARSKADADRAWEQACRSRWRALKLVIQAKLEAIEIGISTIEAEFLSQIMLPNGETFGDYAIESIEQTYLTGKLPSLLPGRS